MDEYIPRSSAIYAIENDAMLRQYVSEAWNRRHQ